ncbi:AEC family transporter [Bombilactobacillus bombi]|uniref:AEC family transporter n=1 Tax=Bombilactobacillus bombi TaxID=1303590 RepID=A0A417ZHN2_9LACO|nr:AEC family transporter [Bombilactobacillus bombi]RHW51219.1 AEC family transporter [Bombilactobacillus bombi]
MNNIFLISVNSVLIIFTIIIVGYILEKSKIFNSTFSQDISNLVVDIALPFSIFLSTQKYITKTNFLLLLKGTILIMIAILLCFVISISISKIFHVKKSIRSLFVNGFVNSNTLFVGLPLNLALFGSSSLPYFLCYFVANTIATWGIGIKLINYDNPEKIVSTNNSWKKLINIFTPPMWGFIIGLIMFFGDFQITGFLKTAFSYLANLVTPLSLIFLGLQLGQTKLSALKISGLDLFTQIGKFVISPLVMYIIIVIAQRLQLVTLQPIFIKTLVVQSATPMLTLLPVMASQSQLDVGFATRILTESLFLFPLAVIVIMLIL